MTRGEKNNNPGNIRHGEKWQGLDRNQPDKDFCTFIAPQWGIRAMAKIIMNYGVNTVGRIINEWAPSSENNTVSYIQHVCKVTGFQSDQPLDVKNYSTMAKLVKAIILHENGEQPYDDSIIDDGLQMAGLKNDMDCIA